MGKFRFFQKIPIIITLFLISLGFAPKFTLAQIPTTGTDANTPNPSWPQRVITSHILSSSCRQNHSFDNHSGTYPGADAIPMVNGVPTVDRDDLNIGLCVKPFHNPNDIEWVGPHSFKAAIIDYDC